ncbi:DMT family transporter [Haliea sp. E1-2-M8]|uniref:DMT family transporter n=1 Tax=Haliea sp. E1-2-M8 TaxID=3064706 RepID=UPI002728AE20|nr:DMT family transporter [Haliea sp. E1-2-M8]MDO8863461.1 DMT family transporter [Haliea sp. E1-2-M8]
MKTWILLALITLSEATIGVFVKLTDGRIPVQTLTFYAFAIATVFLMLALPRVTKQPLELPRGNWKDTFFIGALIAAQSGFFNYAMTLVPIANAVIFWSVAPFFTFILSWLFLGEKAKKSYILIFAIALVGIVVAKPLQEGYMLGNMVALGVGAIYAAMITYIRHEGKTETGNDIAWSLLFAALIMFPSLLFVGPGDITGMIRYEGLGLSLPVMLWAVGLGLISMGFAYLGISIVLKSINANVYSLVDIIVSPAVATLWGFLIFNEVPASSMLYGGALLLGAGFWLTRDMSRDDPSRPVHVCNPQSAH